MSEWIAVVRMDNGKWHAITNDDGSLATWESPGEADEVLQHHILDPLGFKYFELP